jgi:hypothetical protein
MWTFSNPVRIVFGAGALAKAADHIRGRRYALVTYDMPIFKEKASQIATTSRTWCRPARHSAKRARRPR